jgi:hypothetical protein
MPYHFTRIRIGAAPKIAPANLLWGWKCLPKDKAWQEGQLQLRLAGMLRNCWRRPRWIDPKEEMRRGNYEKEYRWPWSRKRLLTPRDFVVAMLHDPRVPIEQALYYSRLLPYVDGGRWLEED